MKKKGTNDKDIKALALPDSVALTEHQQTQPPATFDQIMEGAQRRAALLQLAEYAIACTINEHWVDYHGRPYLQADGAEWIARRVGINYEPVGDPKRTEHWDDAGPYYIYTWTVRAWFPASTDEITEIGVCSSRDDFFAKVKGKMRPAHEVDEADIIKKAYTNGIARAIRGLLGIGALNWDRVKALCGKELAAASSVQFKQTKTQPRSKTRQQSQPRQSRKSGGDFNMMKAITELKKHLHQNRIVGSEESWLEFVSTALGPDKSWGEDGAHDNQGAAMQTWTREDFNALCAEAEQRTGGG